MSLAWQPLLEANPFWPQAAERAMKEDVELHPVDTWSVHRPKRLAVASTKAPVLSLDQEAAEGTFEWHFGDHGHALPRVRQLFKEACHAMSNVKL